MSTTTVDSPKPKCNMCLDYCKRKNSKLCEECAKENKWCNTHGAYKGKQGTMCKQCRTKEKTCTDCKEVKPRDSFLEAATLCNVCKHQCSECKKTISEHMTTMMCIACRRGYVYFIKSDQLIEFAKRDANCPICKTQIITNFNALTKIEGSEVVGGFTIDHEHNSPGYKKCNSSDEVRGLLCNDCNTSLGKFNDDIPGLVRALVYLAQFERTKGNKPHLRKPMSEEVLKLIDQLEQLCLDDKSNSEAHKIAPDTTEEGNGEKSLKEQGEQSGEMSPPKVDPEMNGSKGNLAGLVQVMKINDDEKTEINIIEPKQEFKNL